MLLCKSLLLPGIVCDGMGLHCWMLLLQSEHLWSWDAAVESRLWRVLRVAAAILLPTVSLLGPWPALPPAAAGLHGVADASLLAS